MNIRKCGEMSSQGTKLCCPEWISGSGMVREGEGRMQLHSDTQDVSSLRKVPMLSLSEQLIFGFRQITFDLIKSLFIIEFYKTSQKEKFKDVIEHYLLSREYNKASNSNSLCHYSNTFSYLSSPIQNCILNPGSCASPTTLFRQLGHIPESMMSSSILPSRLPFFSISLSEWPRHRPTHQCTLQRAIEHLLNDMKENYIFPVAGKELTVTSRSLASGTSLGQEWLPSKPASWNFILFFCFFKILTQVL